MKSDGFFSLKFKEMGLFKKLGALFGGSSPMMTIFSCILCLVTPVVLCFIFVGPQTILEYASMSRPYSILLSPSSYSALTEADGSTKIVCFGDSNYFYPPHRSPKADGTETYLPTLLHEELTGKAGLSDVVISQRAFASAGMFDYYCMVYEAMKFSPDLIIIPINWRSFGTDEWDAFGTEWVVGSNWFHPELSALAPLRDGLPPEYENPIRARGISAAKQIEYKMSLYALYPIGMKMWALENAKTFFAELRENIHSSAFAAEELTISHSQPAIHDTVRPKQGKSVAKDFSIDFPMKVEGSNPTFRSLAPIALVASRRGVKVLFYIWPLDQERFEDVGYLNKPLLEQSINLIAEAVDEENVYFTDLSGLLGRKHFFDSNGHCSVEGRRMIARALAPKISEILNEDPGLSK